MLIYMYGHCPSSFGKYALTLHSSVSNRYVQYYVKLCPYFLRITSVETDDERDLQSYEIHKFNFFFMRSTFYFTSLLAVYEIKV